MKRLLPLLFILIAFAPPKRYRGDIKLLIDEKGIETFDMQPDPSTIKDLVEIERPDNSELGPNRSEPEQRKVTVTAWLVGLGKEGDGDYHLILTSVNKKDSLIAEIPDPTQKKVKGFPGLVSSYRKARKFIEDKVDETPGHIHYLEPAEKIKVKVTGVLFFDKMAHGNGHAPNGIEIHPVLVIKKSN
jgi:hypothetical protein